MPLLMDKTFPTRTNPSIFLPCPMAFAICLNDERALSEMYRVLKPGGALCVLEFSTPPNPLMRLGYRIYLRWGIPAWGKLVTGDASGFVYLAKSIKAFPDQEGFTKMLKDAGFSRVEYTNVTFGVATVHIAYKE